MFTHLGSAAVLRVRLGAAAMFAGDECFQSTRRGRKGGIVYVAVGEIHGDSRQWSSAQRDAREGIVLSHFLTGCMVGAELREFRLKGTHRTSSLGERSNRSVGPPLERIHRTGDSFPIGIPTVLAISVLFRYGPKHTERRTAIERGCVL